MKEKRPNEQSVEGNETETVVQEEHKPKLDERFMSNIQGKDFVLYSGLLDLAHQHGLEKLEVECIQLPNKDNGETAICKATAVSKNGSVFTDFGDANPGNVNRKIAPHVLRMASTRAKARVLRDLTNIGITCLEELGDLNEMAEDNQYVPRGQYGGGYKPSNRTFDRRDEPHEPDRAERKEAAPAARTPQQAPARSGDANVRPRSAAASGLPRISDAQKRALNNLATRQGMAVDELQALSEERFGLGVEDLSTADAAALIRYLQQAS